jgi:hypothetical protein
MAAFPHDDIPKEWLQRQLKAGLDHIYDEHKAVETIRERRAKHPDPRQQPSPSSRSTEKNGDT